jgi:hypothetical protein
MPLYINTLVFLTFRQIGIFDLSNKYFRACQFGKIAKVGAQLFALKKSNWSSTRGALQEELLPTSMLQ